VFFAPCLLGGGQFLESGFEFELWDKTKSHIDFLNMSMDHPLGAFHLVAEMT
jgi:hypothetical protein